jgi:hypothetical protein
MLFKKLKTSVRRVRVNPQAFDAWMERVQKIATEEDYNYAGTSDHPEPHWVGLYAMGYTPKEAWNYR